MASIVAKAARMFLAGLEFGLLARGSDLTPLPHKFLLTHRGRFSFKRSECAEMPALVPVKSIAQAHDSTRVTHGYQPRVPDLLTWFIVA